MEDKYLETFKSLKINKAPGFDEIDHLDKRDI